MNRARSCSPPAHSPSSGRALATATRPWLARAARREAPHPTDALGAERAADVLETIDVLDALGAESIATGHLDRDALSLLVDADLATSCSWLRAALAAAMDGP